MNPFRMNTTSVSICTKACIEMTGIFFGVMFHSTSKGRVFTLDGVGS